LYSELIREHYLHPRNVGTLPDCSGKAMLRSRFDSDTISITLRIENNRVADIRFKCVGCPVAIASSSIATEMVMGKTVDDAYALSKQDVADALGGIPEYKMLCSNLSPDAIRLAIDDWRARVAESTSSGEVESNDE
jgi:nitrogen fixation protein NifU and related proteins